MIQYFLLNFKWLKKMPQSRFSYSASGGGRDWQQYCRRCAGWGSGLAPVLQVPGLLIPKCPFKIGLPLVGTDIGRVPEIIEYGRNGFLFPLRDVKALETTLRGLASNFQLRQKMGENAKAMFEKDSRWKIDNMASETEAIYRKWLHMR